MYYTPKNVVYGRVFLNSVLAAFKVPPLAELVDTPKLRLSASAVFSPSIDSTIAGLAVDEANYSGYTAGGVALVLGAPVNLPGQVQGAVTPVLMLGTVAAPFIPSVCYGWWIDDGTNFVCGERFADNMTISFGQAGDFLQLDVCLPLQSLQRAQ